jgi:alcohol dehydrogenase class IV
LRKTTFLPDIAILDPEMTATMPGKVTAATGMDALTHAIECYAGPEPEPRFRRACALHAIELIVQNLMQAVAVPNDLNARGAMLTASFLAAVAFNHGGVGIVHGISHALGGVYHIPHGLANSIILPFSVEHNMESSWRRAMRALRRFSATADSIPVRELGQAVARSRQLCRESGGDSTRPRRRMVDQTACADRSLANCAR